MRMDFPAALAATAIVISAMRPALFGYTERLSATDDAEVLSTVIAIDSGDVLTANLALQKHVTDRTRDYARAIKTEEEANIADAAAVARRLNARLGTSPAGEQLKHEAEDTRTQLAKLDGTAFEGAYLAAMVKAHTNTLSTIDTRLVVRSISPDVKTFIAGTRAHVADHLDKATTLQAK